MLVENIIEGHENAKEAKLRLKKYKQSIVEQVNNESKALMRRALEEVISDLPCVFIVDVFDVIW